MSYAILGSPSRYHGSHPFWTLFFADPVPTPERRTIEDAFDAAKVPGAAGVFFDWQEDRLQVSYGDMWFETSAQWKQARAATREAIDTAHSHRTLSVVVFGDPEDIAGAPKALVLAYVTLKTARGKRRRALAIEALSSGEETLEALGLSFAESFVTDDVLLQFAQRSPAAAERASDAIEAVLRRWMHEYGKKPERFERIMIDAPALLLDNPAFQNVIYAGVRDLPRMGCFLARFSEERPDVWQATRTFLESKHDAAGLLTLAFALAALGEVEAARGRLASGMEALSQKTAKTPLWKVTIPDWARQLEERLQSDARGPA